MYGARYNTHSKSSGSAFPGECCHHLVPSCNCNPPLTEGLLQKIYFPFRYVKEKERKNDLKRFLPPFNGLEIDVNVHVYKLCGKVCFSVQCPDIFQLYFFFDLPLSF